MNKLHERKMNDSYKSPNGKCLKKFKFVKKFKLVECRNVHCGAQEAVALALAHFYIGTQGPSRGGV